METQSISELLDAGLTVTLIGMGTVFVLLGLLVAIVQAMSALSALIEAGGQGTAAAGHGGVDPETVGVISAAIARFRSQRKR